MRLAEARQDRGQHRAAHHLACGQPDRSTFLGIGAGSGAHQRFGSARHRLGVGKQFARGLRGNESGLRAEEQRQAEIGFELVDVPSERRLGQRQLARRRRQAPLGHHCQEGAISFPFRLGHT
ncbi:MAG: hypothetical protein WDM81_12375 [Rhizomicrobium sp.]